MREKAISGMMSAAGRRDAVVKELEETVRLKSVSDVAVQTTAEEKIVPLPVSACMVPSMFYGIVCSSCKAGWEAYTAPNRHVFYVDHGE